MLEPIQGEAGVWPATDQFLQELRALTKAHGLLLIVDEIQTGIGRTGKLFHYEHAGIEPDIMTLGKGIGGGVPLAALLATDARLLLRAWRPGRHLQRQSADVRGGACGARARRRAGIPEIGRPMPACILESELQQLVGAAWSRRSPRPRPVAGARSEIADRRLDRGAGLRRTACCSTRRSRTRCASCRRSTSRGTRSPK